MTETIQEIIRRVSKDQPEIFLQNHEGYYRHSDISALLREIARLRSSDNPWDIYEDWEHFLGTEVGSEFMDIPAQIRIQIFSETTTVEDSVAAARAWLAGHRD